MKKRIVTLILAMATAFSLVACGGSTETNAENTNTENTNTEDANAEGENTQVVVEDGTTYFREFFTTEINTICYMVDGEVEKNAIIWKAFVFNDGKAWMYPLSDLGIRISMGEVAQMTDAEIINMFDNKLQEKLDKEIEACNQILVIDLDNDYTDQWGTTYTGMSHVKEGLLEYKTSLENFDARERFAITDIIYEVYTDGTGNYVEYEIARWNQNNCVAGNIGHMQYIVTVSGSEDGVKNNLLTTWEEGSGIIDITENGHGNIVDYKIIFDKPVKEHYCKVYYAHRSTLYPGEARIYDSKYGGYYIGEDSRVMISRNMLEDNYYMIDTKETADYVDPK